MVFWLSVIVFIAGIMTYMFFPRNDQYQLDIYQQEGNIISFINQHQVAKDLMQQRIMWKISDSSVDAGIYTLPYLDLINSTPDLMSVQDMYQIGLSSALHPNPQIDGSVGSYTSAVVCVSTSCSVGSTGCINGKKLAPCPADERYVLTYGYMPTWWRQEDWRKQAWFKAMLKRTRKSIGCGLLIHRGDSDGNRLYSLDNSQQYIGYQVVNNLRVIPPALTNRLEAIGINTCNPGSKSACADPLQDLMLCMTPFSNPYLGTPVFWWDSLNNTGTGIETGRGIPLEGTLSGNEVTPWTQLTSYTIMGVVSAGEQNKSLFELNDDAVLYAACNGDNCTLSIKDKGTNLVSVSDLPNNREYGFVYMAESGTQTLTVYYSKIETKKSQKILSFTSESNSLDTSGPALSRPKFLDDNNKPHLRAIRIYGGRLSVNQTNHNVQADKKRFGL